MEIGIHIKRCGQPCKDLGKEQITGRTVRAKAQKGTRLDVFKRQEKLEGTGMLRTRSKLWVNWESKSGRFSSLM